MGNDSGADSFIDFAEAAGDREYFRQVRRGLRRGELDDAAVLAVVEQMNNRRFELHVYPGQPPYTLLRCAARYHRPAVVGWLLEHAAGWSSSALDIALHAALDRPVLDASSEALTAQLDTLRLLLNAGAGLECPRTPGGADTPLFYAVAMGNGVAVVQLLRERGAEIFGVHDGEGNSLFHVAAMNDMTDCLDYLFGQLDPQQLNTAINELRDASDRSPLEALVDLARYHQAHEDWERWPSVNKLVEYGARLDQARARFADASAGDVFDEFIMAAVRRDSPASRCFVEHLAAHYSTWAGPLIRRAARSSQSASADDTSKRSRAQEQQHYDKSKRSRH